MLIPHRLSITGFRGYRETVGFEFDRPTTIFFGGNHCGKSSTLNAVEWCLFGDHCAGKQTGIRERIGWVVANQHQPAPEAVVELELANGTGTHLVRRRLRQRGKRGTELEVCLPSGEWLTHDAAERRLARLRQSEFRDFLTTVYQHQEAIRAVLTQEPKERNDAVDRLLGLAVYRNLLDALDRARTGDRHKALRQRVENFERQLQIALQTRERDLEELRSAAEQYGVTPAQQSWAGGLAAARAVQHDLDAFAQEAGLPIDALPGPAGWADLDACAATARQRINALRAALPCVREQQQLFARRSILLQLKAQWEAARAGSDDVGRAVRELDRAHQNRAQVVADLAEVDQDLEAAQTKLRETNRQAALVREAIAYLDFANTAACPLCRQPAPDLLPTLRSEWDDRLRTGAADVTLRIEFLRTRKAQFEKAQERYGRLNQQLETAVVELARLRLEIGALLVTTVQPDADGLALLTRALQAVAEQERTLQQAITDKVSRLDAIERGVEKLRRIRDILAKEEKGRILEQIQQRPVYRELEQLRDQAAEAVGDVEAIKAAVCSAARTEAAAKLHAAEATIDCYFRQLTRNPGVERICLQVTATRQRNSYAITDGAGADLTPILSQGDLNALALAIFLGLAATESNGAFGFIMLDDPSQSLGTAHKEALVQVLDQVSQKKQLVVATMDAEFRALLQHGLTRAKQEYVFDSWTVAHGPSLAPW